MPFSGDLQSPDPNYSGAESFSDELNPADGYFERGTPSSAMAPDDEETVEDKVLIPGPEPRIGSGSSSRPTNPLTLEQLHPLYRRATAVSSANIMSSPTRYRRPSVPRAFISRRQVDGLARDAAAPPPAYSPSAPLRTRSPSSPQSPQDSRDSDTFGQLRLERREPIFKGDLYRPGANRLVWSKTHAQLFDHYFVLAKTVAQRDDAGNKEIHDVFKLIPMELLVLERTSDDPLVRSSVPGFGAAAAAVARLTQAPTNGEQSFSVEPTDLSSDVSAVPSSGSVVSAAEPEEDTKLLYPFRIKHLGKPESYALYAPTSANRRDWCEKIIEAKERHAASLMAENAEPFQLRVIADQSFRYDTASEAGSGNGVRIRGSSVDRAISAEVRQFSRGTQRAAGCPAFINCATEFSCNGESRLLMGADDGIYVSEASNPREWTRTVQVNYVTQMAILENLSLCLVIANKSLIAYALDIVVLKPNAPESSSLAYQAPRKLSGARNVSFFATADMNERTLIFYKEGNNRFSTFKVLETVFQTSRGEKSKLFRGLRPNSDEITELFRVCDEFYIPSECYTINLFKKSIAISTQRGFELLSLDRKVPMSIPDLKQAAISASGARLAGQRPLGMFRVSDDEFLLCYEECAVYVDRHGEISRSLVPEFAGKAKTAAMYDMHLVLFHSDFVEVCNAQTGRLEQVIAGRDVRCLDFGVAATGQDGQRTLKFTMEHPETADCQLVLEMVLNETQRMNHSTGGTK